MQPTEFEVDGQRYRADRLNAFQQLHVSRKIAPLVPPLIPLFLEISQKGLSQNLAVLPELIEPLAKEFARMPDADSEYVVATCLSVVRRHVGGHWTPVWSASGQLMFDDLNTLGTLLRLVIRVIQDNLGPFISGLLVTAPQKSAATGTESPGTPSPVARIG